MQYVKAQLTRERKFLFVTGGVLSGLGKGVVTASIGKLLNSKYKIVTIKCDGYLNVDPGTMNPIEHGEVFVLDDGGEVDLDFGHYERFMNIDCKSNWNITSGKVFLSLMEKERRGDYLGKTVQVIPHVTGEIRERLCKVAEEEDADIVIIEIGGTVGDLENLWFLEAGREMIRDIGKKHVSFIHLGLVPVIDSQGQQKTKPLQQSIIGLRDRGIFPDVIVGRSKDLLQQSAKEKLHLLLNLDKGGVISDPDLEYVYELPIIFEQEGLREYLCQRLDLETFEDLKEWKQLVQNIKDAKKEVTIAIAGKYCDLADSYISISEALIHCTAHTGIKSNIKFIETSDVESLEDAKERLDGVDGVIVPGGFGTRGTEGKIKIVQYVRENNIPFLGICYGMQLAVIEHARNCCGLEGANSAEINPNTPYPVIDILPEQKKVTQKGGTMRLGSYEAILKKDSLVYNLYEKEEVFERHRHRYEVNPEYHKQLETKDFLFSGMSPDGKLAEFIEITSHPYFTATQGHPELKSRLENPAPLFIGLVKAADKHN